MQEGWGKTSCADGQALKQELQKAVESPALDALSGQLDSAMSSVV